MTKKENKIWKDSELGEVIFRKSNRAKHYSIRIKNREVSVVFPQQGSYLFAKGFFLSKRNKIIKIIREQTLAEPGRYDEALLRRQAKAHLPGRLAQLAQEHGFSYRAVCIRKSRSRWGSCSTKGNINLSLFLMILPEHLIDYVILHELCHTIHMNHSPAFWELLDKYTDNRAKLLRRELKNYPIPTR